MKPLVIALGLLFINCGKNGPRLDCGAYGAKYADTVGADPSRRNTVMDGATRDCEAGRVDQKKFDCVQAASTAAAIRACEGLVP